MTKILLNIDNDMRKRLEELNPDLGFNCKYYLDDKNNTIAIIIYADWNWSMNEELRDLL